jgi:hypothetical protein
MTVLLAKYITGTGSSISSSNTANTLTGVGTNFTVTIGDLVFCCFGSANVNTSTGVTDNLGNSYTAQNAGTLNSGTTVAGSRCYWSRVSVAGNLTSFSIACPASANGWTFAAVGWTGPFLSSPLDANPANSTDITTVFTWPATGTLAQAAELVVAGITWTSSFALGWGSGFSGHNGPASTPNVGIGGQVVNATTSVQCTQTMGGNATSAVEHTASFMIDTSVVPGITPPVDRIHRTYIRR